MFHLDTNVLFAAIFQAHARHESVNRWLASVAQFATCGLTQIGVFRLLLMDAPMHGHPLDPPDAHAVLVDFTRNKGHAFLSCNALSPDFVGKTSGHKAAVDDYLVQIAQSAGYRLATLDRALSNRWTAHSLLVG